MIQKTGEFCDGLLFIVIYEPWTMNYQEPPENGTNSVCFSGLCWVGEHKKCVSYCLHKKMCVSCYLRHLYLQAQV